MHSKLIVPLALYFSAFVNGDPISSKFLMDFFETKPVMITAQFCWNYDEITYFMHLNLESNNSKQVAIYQNTSEKYHILKHLSNDNYFVIDLNNCKQSWRLLNKINRTYEFRFPLKFLLLINDDMFENHLQIILSNYTIYPSTDMIIAKRVDDTFELYQPYRIDKFAEINWEDYGSWNESGLHEKLENISFPQRRSNMRRANMNVVLFMEFEDTWNHLDDFRWPRIDTFTKQNYGAIKALMEFCNINFAIIPVNSSGYYNAMTKSWNGLVGMLLKKTAQIAGSSPFFTTARLTVVDFIKMQNPLEIKFAMKKPPLSLWYNIFTLPFQTNVWKALAVITALFTVALFINLNWEGKYYQKINHKEKFNSMDVCLIIFEALCQQGSVVEFKSVSGRILSFFMFASFMMFYVSYSAYIIVLLQSTHIVANYEELISGNMEVGGMETSYMRVYLAGSTKPIEQELYAKKIGPKGFYPLEEGMQKVQEGSFAFHGEVVGMNDYIARKFTDGDVCDLQMMDGYMEHMKGYTMVPKNSPYKEIFKVALMKIDEYGIQRRNYNRYLSKPTCYSAGGSFESVGIIDIYNGLLLFACGVGAALILFFIEVVLYRMSIQKEVHQSWMQ